MKAVWPLLACLVLSAPGVASAWDVRRPGTDACHEYLTLGALGAAAGSWQRISRQPGEQLLAALIARAAETGGTPRDAPTRAWLEALAGRYQLAERALLEQFVLISLVEGVRAPDFEGLHPSQLAAIRSLHVGDDRQPRHALRRRTDAPGEAGDLAAIRDARKWIEARLDAATTVGARATIRATLPHFGEVSVRAFGPAYELGIAAHTLQDAYSHTLRDEEFRIVAVLNWVNAVEPNHDTRRHGPRHSDRLDACNIEVSAIDARRYRAAQQATLDLFTAVLTEPEPNNRTATAAAVLDEVLTYRSGCGPDNAYCDSPWYPVAMEEATGPLSWMGCTLDPRLSGGGAVPWGALLCSLALLMFRFRSRTSTPD